MDVVAIPSEITTVAVVINFYKKGEFTMCGGNCEDILWIIILIFLITNCCGNNNGRGIGCGCN